MNVLTRWETKYELDSLSAQRLRHIVGRFLPLYEYLEGQPVTYVTTVYFDTPRLDFYKIASASEEYSVKMRLRAYSYTLEGGHFMVLPHCFLEIKRRSKGFVAKRRLCVPKRLLSALLSGRDIWPELRISGTEAHNKETKEIYLELRRFLAMYTVFPRSVVQYQRQVYQTTESELRITFDDHITMWSPDERLYERCATLSPQEGWTRIRKLSKIVMEIKRGGECPGWLNVALKEYLPRNISKFTESINVLAS